VNSSYDKTIRHLSIPGIKRHNAAYYLHIIRSKPYCTYC